MFDFIIIGCKEVMPEAIAKLIKNIHTPDFKVFSSTEPVKHISTNTKKIYIGIKPSDLWEILNKEKITEENRLYFNDVVCNFARYEYSVNKTFWIDPDSDMSFIKNIAYEIWNYIYEINKMGGYDYD